MADRATLYSPLVREEQGKVWVEFSPDHPGYHDQKYRDHRARIAKQALSYRLGQPVPVIGYTEEEQGIWRLINADLAIRHERYACREYLAAADRLALPSDRIPQLGEVSEVLRRETGFMFAPAAGLVGIREFYGSLASHLFLATQYIRHSSFPRFSPEPDMIHEIVGHGTHLCDRRWAEMYELFGRAVRRLTGLAAVKEVSRVFWFTVEYGLVREGGKIKGCGASLLSSPGEMEHFHNAEIKPLDLPAMVGQEYQVEKFQPVLFCADSFAHLEDFLGDFLTTVEDREAVPST